MFNKSGLCFAAGDSDWRGYTADLTESAVLERDGSSDQSARLQSLLTSTTIKESSIFDTIEKLGGGQKGLSGLVKAVLFWLGAQNRSDAESSEECASPLELLKPLTEEYDFLMSLAPLCRDNDGSFPDMATRVQGGEEHGQTPDESGSVGGLSHGLRSQGSSPATEDNSSGDWAPPTPESVERRKKSLLMNVNPSPNCANNLISFRDNITEQSNNMWGQSPSFLGYPSPDSSDLYSSYMNWDLSSFDAVENDPVTADGYFDASPLSPPPVDLQSLDFNYFLTQVPASYGEKPHGCCQIYSLVGPSGYLSPQSPVDAEQPVISQLEVVAEAKASHTKVTRLARKKRKLIREASFQQDNGDASAASSLLTGESSGLHSPEHPAFQCLLTGDEQEPSGLHSSGGPLRSACRAIKSCSTSRQPACTATDLQFLLLKVLRPSDLGKLGRIVLSKKDAESRLPHLDAKEGVQFPCEDYHTGEVMLLRYRFWPNHRSRMYLFENTGHFVRRHHLREHDKMLLYRDKESGSYVMRAGKADDCLDSLQVLDQMNVEERAAGEAQDRLDVLQTDQ